MLFNPLFIQSTGQTDASSSIKQSKFNTPTYLFSDIIKIINENTIGETSVASAAGGLATANVAEVGTTSSESMTQLLSLAEDKPGTDNINISLNDLLKNLLISSNSEQVKDSKQVDNSSKKNTTSNNLISSLSKADAEKLLLSLAASLLQLNISPDSLQQVKPGNTGPNSTNQDLKNLLAGLNQTGNNIAELIINLPKNSKQIETSKGNISNQPDALTSLYETISSILTKFTGNVSSDNSGKISTNDTKTDSAGKEVSSDVQQLAAALINLYQNNNNLVININSGDSNIKIEIANDTANSDKTMNINSGAVLNAQDQADGSIKGGQQSVPEVTTGKAQEAALDGKAASAAAAVSKAKDSIPANTEEIAKPLIVKTQSGPNNVSDKDVTILSDQDKNSNQLSKSNIPDTTDLKSEDKLIVKVSSKLSNTGSQKDDIRVFNETPNTVVRKGNEIKVSNYDEAETSIKNNPTNFDNKTAAGSELKINATGEDKNPVKNNLDLNVKTKNSVNEPQQAVDAQNTEDITAQNLNSDPKEVIKELAGQGTKKTNQVNQAGALNRQPDNSSNELTGDTVSVKQSSNEEVAQVMNNKQGNSFSDQQQKKPADSSKNSDIKTIEQLVNDFSTKTTDSVKEKFMNQTTSSDSPEKTIKITEITKEISNIIQQNTSKSVVLQLKPESLGKIKVTIDVNNNIVTARVEVDTEAVKQIVQNNTAELRQSLNLNGMQLSSLSVNVSGGEQKPYQSQAQKKKSGYQSSEKRIEDNASLASAKSLGYNTYEYLI